MMRWSLHHFVMHIYLKMHVVVNDMDTHIQVEKSNL